MNDNDKPSGVDNQTVITNDSPAADTSPFEKEQRQTAVDMNSKQGSSMQVKVYSPFKDYYDGQAFSISAENLTGPFDILPKHHNFISLLLPCEVVVRTAKDAAQGPVRININGGIMHVKADEVVVFLDV